MRIVFLEKVSARVGTQRPMREKWGWLKTSLKESKSLWKAFFKGVWEVLD